MITTNDINNIFQNNKTHESLKNVFVLREDGILLYSKLETKFASQKKMLTNMAVLSAGAWQAGHALFNETNLNELASPDEEFRFTFDSGKTGVYLTEIKLKEQKLLLGSLFYDEVNPGALKNRLRMVKYLLENELAAFDSPKKSEFMFSNITDDEIDGLFKF